MIAKYKIRIIDKDATDTIIYFCLRNMDSYISCDDPIEVTVWARDYKNFIDKLDILGIDYEEIGREYD